MFINVFVNSTKSCGYEKNLKKLKKLKKTKYLVGIFLLINIIT